MFRPTVVASTLALSGLANAFYDSVPFIAWSNRPHNIVGSLHQHNPAVPSHAQVINSVLSNDDLCQLDAVVVIGQPGLHANQLGLVQYESPLRNYLTEMPSKSYFPYVPLSSVVETDSVARDVAALCGSTANEWTSGQTYEGDAKHVLYFDLPETVGRYWEEEGLLHEKLSEISSQFGSYAVLLTGTSNTTPALVTKRQQANSLSQPNFSNKPVGVVTTFANDSLPTGGILARYQLLTPGLLTSLLIAFGILIPLLMVGINALASIQSPLRTEAPKGPSLEKKNQ